MKRFHRKTIRQATTFTQNLENSDDLIGQSAIEFSANITDESHGISASHEIIQCVLKLVAEGMRVIFLTEDHILGENLTNSLTEKSLTAEIVHEI